MSIELNGLLQYLTAVNSLGLGPNSDIDTTLAVWFKRLRSNHTNDEVVFCRGYETSSTTRAGITVRNSNVVCAQTTFIAEDLSDGGSVSDQNWHLAIARIPSRAPAWTASTAYTTGQCVMSNTNCYECISGGTSGGTGPNGTGTYIQDGTAAWKYKYQYQPLQCRLDNLQDGTPDTSVRANTGIFDAVFLGKRSGSLTGTTQLHFNGRLAHAAVWKKWLTGNEMGQLLTRPPDSISYSAGLSSQDLVSYWPLLSGVGNAVLGGPTLTAFDGSASYTPTFLGDNPPLSAGRSPNTVYSFSGGFQRLTGNLKG